MSTTNSALEQEARALSTSILAHRHRLGCVLSALVRAGSYCGGKYTCFSAFLKGECPGISANQANNMIRVSDNFSASQLKAFGPSKLYLVTEITSTPGDRKKALEMLAEGAKYRDLIRRFRPDRLIQVTARPGSRRTLAQLRADALALPEKHRLELAETLWRTLRNRPAKHAA